MTMSSSSGPSDSDDSSEAVATPTTAATTSTSTSKPSSPTRTRRPVRKRRRSRATYHVRKDEIQVLQTRMKELELELKALRFQTLVQENGEPTRTSSEDGSDVAEAIPTQAKSKFTQHLLKDAIRTQQFALAGLQAMLSKYSSLQETSPLHVGVRLTTDFEQRRVTLLAARNQMLQDAKRFIKERSQGMDPLKAFNEQERFETAGGDFCVSSFEIQPLPSGAGANTMSARSAFDTLYFLIRNVEITFSEWIGHITIRENDDSLDAQYSQHRLVATAAPTAVQVETNVVTCAEFLSDGDGEGDDGIGIIVVDAIDDDELYPYQPNDRVRRDTCGLFMLQHHSNEQTSAVVLMGCFLSKMHASKLLNADVRIAKEVRASLGTWGDKLVQALYDAALRTARAPHASSSDGDGAAYPEL